MSKPFEIHVAAAAARRADAIVYSRERLVDLSAMRLSRAEAEAAWSHLKLVVLSASAAEIKAAEALGNEGDYIGAAVAAVMS